MARFSTKIPQSAHYQLPEQAAQELTRLTELGFAIDASTSMLALASPLVTSFNLLLGDQKRLSTNARATTVQFSDHTRLLSSGAALGQVKPLSLATYQPEGNTALLDGVGTLIDVISERWLGDKGSRVIVTVFTDGFENASRVYTRAEVAEKIRYYQAQGWHFIFVLPVEGYDFARTLGVPNDHLVEFGSNVTGIFHRLSRAISAARLGDKNYPLLLKA